MPPFKGRVLHFIVVEKPHPPFPFRKSFYFVPPGAFPPALCALLSSLSLFMWWGPNTGVRLPLSHGGQPLLTLPIKRPPSVTWRRLLESPCLHVFFSNIPPIARYIKLDVFWPQFSQTTPDPQMWFILTRVFLAISFPSGGWFH